MESEAIDWEQDLPLDADEAYRSLVRSLRRTKAFNLLFVRCSPDKANQIVENVQLDVPEKTISVIQLNESIDNLYDYVAALPNRDQINILFIKGLEYSIYEYEDREYGDINRRSRSEVYSGNWKDVPRILGHLNLNRERFRDNFPICFVFLVPEFVLKYFIRRAPDFFDWRSNIFEFSADRETVETASQQFLEDNDWESYTSLSDEERVERMLQIRSWADEDCQSLDQKAKLLREYGRLLRADSKKCEESLAYFNEAITLKNDFYEGWYNRGNALKDLGRHEEAINSYDKALEIKPDYYYAWNNRGNLLRDLGRHEEAITSYDKALEVKPDYHYAWNGRGNSLKDLGRHEDAISSYDRALEIKPDYHYAWHSRGVSLRDLGRHEDAISSYDKALEIKPDYHYAWHNRGSSLFNLVRYEEAIASYDQALEIKPEYKLAIQNRLRSQLRLSASNFIKGIKKFVGKLFFR